jgi:hypothetical protein
MKGCSGKNCAAAKPEESADLFRLGRAWPAHPRLLAPKTKDVDTRDKPAQDDFKVFPLNPVQVPLSDAVSPDSLALARQ